GYHWNQIAAGRVSLEHRFEVLVEDGCIHDVCNVSTIANVDRWLARTIRKLFPETASLVGACVNDLIGFPAGGAFASRLKIQLNIAGLTTKALYDYDRQCWKGLIHSNGADPHVRRLFGRCAEQIEQRRYK